MGSEPRGITDLYVGSPVHLEVQCKTGPTSEGHALTISRRTTNAARPTSQPFHARVRLAGPGEELEHLVPGTPRTSSGARRPAYPVHTQHPSKQRLCRSSARGHQSLLRH